jgi:DNA-binding NarL/FixJ family response regulator
MSGARPYCERNEADAVVLDAAMLARMVFGKDSPIPAPIPATRLGTLTPREREVLVLLGAGLSKQRIGSLLRTAG